MVVVRVGTKEDQGPASAAARLPSLYGAAAQFSVLTILLAKELLVLKYFRYNVYFIWSQLCAHNSFCKQELLGLKYLMWTTL